MANKLDLFENVHLSNCEKGNNKLSSTTKEPSTMQPYKSIRHDNMTGRWLTTFQAIFHPHIDVFAVGSMRQPRCIEIFDPTEYNKAKNDGLLHTVSGNALTAVASRLAFHPRTDQLVLVGGNSSGRVTIVRK
jgi:hypothetical protein